MRDLSDVKLRRVYMDHCARLMSMQKLFRHNPDAREVEQLVLDACFKLQKVLEPHLTPEEAKPWTIASNTLRPDPAMLLGRWRSPGSDPSRLTGRSRSGGRGG